MFVVGLLMSSSITQVSLAEEKATKGVVASKDEVIYALLQSSGKQKEAFIVNMLDVTKKGKITDYGMYSSVKNLTDLTELTQSDEKITFEAPEGKFYYQGNKDDIELPWNFTIRYELDGKRVSAEELIEEDGRLAITIEVSENKAVDKTFFENYLLQISIPFDADTTSDIEAQDAVIASAGKEELVTFTVMPEKEASFTVEADVVDFEMEGIEISGVPSTMNIDVPDTDDMSGDIKTLADAIADVNSGVAELKSGIAELNNGTKELRNGSEQYKAGIHELDDSSAQLVAGSSEMNDGLQQLNKSLQGIADIDLDGLKQLQAGMSDIGETFDEARKGIHDLQKGYSEAYKALEKSIDNIPAHDISKQDFEKLYESDADKATIKKLEETYIAAQTVKGTFSEVKQGFKIVDDTLGKAVKELDEAANSVHEVVEEIAGSLEDINIDEGINELTTGVDELATNYGQFHAGLIKYTKGVHTLANNYTELDNGINELSKGTGDLTSGVRELHRGTDKLERSTRDLPAEMTKEIDEMIAEFDKSDFDPISFIAPKKNKDIASVQFVFKTEQLKKDEPNDEEEEPEEKKGFWQKFLDLFR